MVKTISQMGGFLKWGYPQIIHSNRISLYKPSILGYPHDYGNPQMGGLSLFVLSPPQDTPPVGLWARQGQHALHMALQPHGCLKGSLKDHRKWAATYGAFLRMGGTRKWMVYMVKIWLIYDSYIGLGWFPKLEVPPKWMDSKAKSH